MGDFKKQLETIAKNSGSSLFGVASIDRFKGAPRGHHPTDWVPNAKAVISIAIQIPSRIHAYERLLKNSELINGELRKEVLMDHFYSTLGIEVINRRLEEIGLQLAVALENAGFDTIYFPAAYSDSQKHIQEKIPGRFGLISNRHVAVRAGLGEFGLNNIVVTPQFGASVRFLSIVTEAELEPNQLIKDKVCLGKECLLCIKKCPPGALKLNSIIKWNEVWLDPVSRTDQDLCRSKRKELMCIGRCARICPIYQDESLNWDDDKL